MRTLASLTAAAALLAAFGFAGTAMADHPGHNSGANPPSPPLGPKPVPTAAGQGQASSRAVRMIISSTIQNPNVLSPVKGGFK